jgi:hypothetical protein
MNRNFSADMIPVFLPSIDDSKQNDQNLEPQYVRIRSNNMSWIALDSNDKRITNPTPQDCVDFSLSNITTRKIKRFGLESAFYNWPIPNVNTRNNIITFFSSFSSTTHTVTLTEGFYQTLTALSTEMQTQLNSVAGASGLTFTLSIPANLGYVLDMTTVGGSFYFTDTCKFITKGLHLLHMPSGVTKLTNSLRTGQADLQYTRWFDIVSFQLDQYNKNPFTSSRNGEQNIVARIYMGTAQTPWIPDYGYRDYLQNNIRYVNFNRDQSLANIDFKVYDEFGDPLYVPTNSEFGFNMILMAEL